MRAIALDIDAPADYPLDLETLKTDLRISGDDLDDVIMTQYLPDAVSWAEGFMHRSIISRTHRWILSDFPISSTVPIVLPRGKTQSIEKIEYSSDGSTITLTGPSSTVPGTDYQEDLRGHAGRILPNRNADWPDADDDVPSPVVITFVAGWSASDVPKDIKRALTVSIFEAMELNGLLLNAGRESGFDIEFRDKLISAWRIP